MERLLNVFFLRVLTVFVTAIAERKGISNKAIELTPGLFKTSRTFNIVSVVIMVILVVLYTLWW
jgi:SSS family solute:Na+ symporter